MATHRSAVTGRFVKAKHAKANPKTTVTHSKSKKAGGKGRSTKKK